MTLHLKSPLSLSETEVIEHIVNAARDLNLEVFMVGAMARIILLEKVFGLPVARASRDVDFAVVVESWAHFAGVKNVLCERHDFVTLDGNLHRLRKKMRSPEEFYSVDLIPIGGVQDAFDQLAWPPEMQIVMSVAGFSDALHSTVRVELTPGLVVKIASLPAIALLKIMAWRERGTTTRGKDAVDLITLCTQYLNAGNFERLFDEFPDLPSRYLDHDHASAWILGHDTGLISSPKNIQTVINTLSSPSNKLKMASQMAQSKAGKVNPLDFCMDSIDAFLNGVLSVQR